MPLISPRVVLVFLHPLMVSATPSGWDVAMQQVEGHPELRAADAMVDATLGRQRQAATLPNPHFEVELLPEQDSAVELRVEYPLDGVLKRGFRVAIAEAEAQAQRLQRSDRAVELAYQLRVAWLERVGAGEQRRLGELRLEAHAAALELAEVMAAAGNLPDLDLARYRASYAVAKAELFPLQETEREKEAALERWSPDPKAWALPDQVPMVPEVNPPDPSLDALLSVNFSLSALERRMNALAEAQRLNTLEGWLPELAVDVHALVAGDDGERSQWRWGGGLSVGLPIFDRRSGDEGRLVAEREALAWRREGLVLAVRAAGKEALARRSLAHQRALQLHRAADASQRVMQDELQRQYNAMQLGPFALVEGRLRSLELERMQAQSRLNYWLADTRVQALWAGRQVGAAVQNAEETRATPAQGDH